MPKQHKRGSGGNKKHGRNKATCDMYKLQGRREKNKIKKLEKILKKQPNNLEVKKILTKCYNTPT